MIGGLQGEEWKFIQKYLRENISHGVSKNRAKFTPRMGCANFEGVVRKFRTPLEKLSSEGHIFLISAPNHTRFKVLDFLTS